MVARAGLTRFVHARTLVDTLLGAAPRSNSTPDHSTHKNANFGTPAHPATSTCCVFTLARRGGHGPNHVPYGSASIVAVVPLQGFGSRQLAAATRFCDRVSYHTRPGRNEKVRPNERRSRERPNRPN